MDVFWGQGWVGRFGGGGLYCPWQVGENACSGDPACWVGCLFLAGGCLGHWGILGRLGGPWRFVVDLAWCRPTTTHDLAETKQAVGRGEGESGWPLAEIQTAEEESRLVNDSVLSAWRRGGESAPSRFAERASNKGTVCLLIAITDETAYTKRCV